MPLNKYNLYWNKKDGERILISEMSNSYLLSTMKNLESTAKNNEGKLVQKDLHPKYNVLKMHALARDII